MYIIIMYVYTYPMHRRIKQSHWVITKISLGTNPNSDPEVITYSSYHLPLSDNSRIILKMIQVL